MDGATKYIFLLACLWLVCEVSSEYDPCGGRPCRYAWQEKAFLVDFDSSEHGQSKDIYRNKTSCPCGWTNKDGGRIVGGRETLVNEYPYMAAVLKKNDDGTFGAICGGAIITPYHVLTAAHCMREKIVAVSVGEHNLKSEFESKYTEVYPVSKVIPHERYDSLEWENDIAMLVTHRRIKFHQRVGPVCLPKEPIRLLNEYVKVTGWGYTKNKGDMSDALLKVNLKVIPLKDCQELYWNTRINTTDSTQFCTYGIGKDSCQGDSGGPLVWLDQEVDRFTLAGLVSYGWACGKSTPGVNTMVHAFLDWIMKTMDDTTPPGEKVNYCRKT